MRKVRATYVQPKPVHPVQPNKIPGLIMEGNKVIGLGKPPRFITGPVVSPTVKTPEIDADGNIVPEY